MLKPKVYGGKANQRETPQEVYKEIDHGVESRQAVVPIKKWPGGSV